MNESEAGSDATFIKTMAEKEGKDYLLNGRKCFITNGSIAHLYSVFAVTDPDQGTDGISAFVVEEWNPRPQFWQERGKAGDERFGDNRCDL